VTTLHTVNAFVFCSVQYISLGKPTRYFSFGWWYPGWIGFFRAQGQYNNILIKRSTCHLRKLILGGEDNTLTTTWARCNWQKMCFFKLMDIYFGWMLCWASNPSSGLVFGHISLYLHFMWNCMWLVVDVINRQYLVYRGNLKIIMALSFQS